MLLERGGGSALSRLAGRRLSTQPPALWFLEPSARELIPNWKDTARRLLAEFRADFARTFRDAQVRIFVETLRGESAFFAEAWDEQAVQSREGGLRVFNHPHDGLVSFIQHTFAPAERPDYKLVINTPAGRKGRLPMRIELDNSPPRSLFVVTFAHDAAPLGPRRTLRNRNAPANFRIGASAHGRSIDR